MKPFPIPLVPMGPGTHNEDETLDYMPMPKDMDTYQAPILPEPEQFTSNVKGRLALNEVLSILERVHQGDTAAIGAQVSLNGLPAVDRNLVNQVLGEGEASALITDAEQRLEIRVQEAIFAGVWRIMTWRDNALVDDVVEVGAVPQLVRNMAREDSAAQLKPWQGNLPPNVLNAPMLVDEIRDHSRRWRVGQQPHVINLTLLPVSPEDIAYLDHEIGTGRILMLSRGYGNCRITNTRLPNCWRVVYYNSMEKVILNTVEVVDMPEVAMAAPEDLSDSLERLKDVLEWLGTA